MNVNTKIIFCCFLSLIFWGIVSLPGFSQETTADSLQLPEVVITGIEQLKIQRELPKVTPILSQAIVRQTMRDRSDSLLQQADRLALTQPRQAEHVYLQALLLDPTNSRAYLRLGAVYQASEQYTMAVDAYQKAIAGAAEIPEAHYQLGILFESRLRDPQQAMAHYRSYLQLGGIDRRAQIWLRNLERAQAPQSSQETPEE
jgi:tetratricopeptide (TPR) repeat protein